MRQWVTAILLGLAIGVGIVVVAWFATSDPLTRVLVPLPMLAAILPPVVARWRSRQRWIIAAVAALGVVVGLWMIGVGVTGGLAGVYVTWTAVLVSAIELLAPRPRLATLRSTGVVVMAWAWLLWPIWLAPQLVEWKADVPGWATQLHPLFAANAAMVVYGIWTEQPTAYALTPLGQDVTYLFPSSAWPAALTQGLLGAVFLLLATGYRVRRRCRVAARRRVVTT